MADLIKLKLAQKISLTIPNLSSISGVCVDASGDVFISDSENHVVYKMRDGGDPVVLAGQFGVSGSADGQGTSATFDGPISIAAAGNGSVYLIDSGNEKVRRIDGNGNVFTMGSTSGTGASEGLAVAASGEIYLTQEDDDLVRMKPVADSMSNQKTLIEVDGLGDAAGIAVIGESVYVCDSTNSCIFRVKAGVSSVFAGLSGSTGDVNGQGSAARFNGPTHITASASGMLYVVDAGNNSIRMIDENANVRTIVGNIGSLGGIAVDAGGNIYLIGTDLDNNGLFTIYLDTDDDVSNFQRFTLHKLEDDGDVAPVASWLPARLAVENIAIAQNWDDLQVYVSSFKYQDGVVNGYILEKFDPETPYLRSEVGPLAEEIRSFVYDSVTDDFVGVIANESLIRMSTSGDITTIKPSAGVVAVTFASGTLFGLTNDVPTKICTIDQITGDILTSTDLVLSTPGFTIQQAVGGIAYFGLTDVLYATVWLWNGSNSHVGLLSIDKDTGDCSVLETYGDNRINSLTTIITNPEMLYASTRDTETVQRQSIYHLDTDTLELGDPILVLTSDKNDTDSAIAWNPDDQKMYRMARRRQDFVDQESYVEYHNVFERTDEIVIEAIPLSGVVESDGVEESFDSFISDGGNDMYDGGNIIKTNLSEDRVEWTHTQQTGVGPGNFVQTADGTVEDGTTWFGSGSTYFTNMYADLFVMAAHDVNIDTFGLEGNLGADGGGAHEIGSFAVGGDTVYWRKVHTAGDPSINQMFIVPGDGSGITPSSAGNTDIDDLTITGLTGANVTKLYYILFASTSGGNVPVQTLTDIATAFLTAINGAANLGDVLTAVTANAGALYALIPNPYNFTDEGEDINTVGDSDGVGDPYAMCWAGNDEFFLSGDEGLFKVTTSGVITEINTDMDDTMRGLVMVDDELYGTSGTTIYIIDQEDGDIINDDLEVIVEGTEVQELFGLDSINGFFYALAVVDGYDGRVILKIDPETGFATVITTTVPDYFSSLAIVPQ